MASTANENPLLSSESLKHIQQYTLETANNTTFEFWWDGFNIFIAVTALVFSVFTFCSQNKTSRNTKKLSQHAQRNLLLDLVRHLYRNLVITYTVKTKLEDILYKGYPSEEHLIKLKVPMENIHLEAFYGNDRMYEVMHNLYLNLRNYNEEIDVACIHFKDTNLSEEVKKRDLNRVQDLNQLRGIEGDAASVYFDVFPYLILNQKSDFPFNGRNRRPPKDAVNAMLSFVYTLIANDVASALETVGLDPYVGFLHALRPGRTSLALDVMEELRAYLGDRLVLSLINRRQVTAKDFLFQGNESVIMTDSCRKVLLTAWQNRKKEMIIHPYLNEKIPIGLLPYVQSMLLARFLRGDLDDYPVFLIR